MGFFHSLQQKPKAERKRIVIYISGILSCIVAIFVFFSLINNIKSLQNSSNQTNQSVVVEKTGLWDKFKNSLSLTVEEIATTTNSIKNMFSNEEK